MISKLKQIVDLNKFFIILMIINLFLLASFSINIFNSIFTIKKYKANIAQLHNSFVPELKTFSAPELEKILIDLLDQYKLELIKEDSKNWILRGKFLSFKDWFTNLINNNIKIKSFILEKSLDDQLMLTISFELALDPITP